MTSGILFPLVCLSACENIEYDNPAETSETVLSETESAETPPRDERKTLKYETDTFIYSREIEAETDGNIQTEIEEYSGKGYSAFAVGQSFTLRLDLTYSGHYDMTAFLAAYGDTVVEVSSGDVSFGAFYLSESKFVPQKMTIYLPKGTDDIRFTCLAGVACFDKISIVNTPETDISGGERYGVKKTLSNLNASVAAQSEFAFLTDTFGKKILTGQHVTAGTNTEIEAVKSATGREPAIRVGDMVNATASPALSTQALNYAEKEIELAKQWFDGGGLVAFTWSWYAPNTSAYYKNSTEFNLADAVTKNDISLYEDEMLEDGLTNGTVSKDAVALLRDIDAVSARLAVLREADIPVLWEPLPQAGAGLYWWSGDSEAYLWLYKMMYRRMTEYNGLDNLIWVWSGEDYDYFPGDNYVDIIGESVYKNNNKSSERVKFDYTDKYGSARPHPAAISQCGVVPNPDLFLRDGAVWLWFSVYSGDYIIKEDGSLSQQYSTKAMLNYAYNHELTLCRDELPDMRNYGAETQ